VDAVDRAILKAVQEAFPETPRPYAAIARALGLAEDDVHRRAVGLMRSGVIRRVGPLFSSRALGFRGHLLAARVRPGAVAAAAALLADRGEVTHNYLRTGAFNVWFTAMLPEGEGAEPLADAVRACPGVEEVRAFRTRRVFKLDASFRVAENADD